MRRPAPRPFAAAVERVAHAVAPLTPLAQAQRHWSEAVGSRVASEAHPVAEHEGVVTVACRSAVWAGELDLLSADLLARLNRAASRSGEPPPFRRLRFVTSAPRRGG